jgi:hypothetical protein
MKLVHAANHPSLTLPIKGRGPEQLRQGFALWLAVDSSHAPSDT